MKEERMCVKCHEFPVQKPSKVICRKCMDKIGDFLEKETSRLEEAEHKAASEVSK